VARRNTNSYRNHLLDGLPPDDLALLAPLLEPLAVEVRHSIEVRERTIKHIYFPEAGFASVVATTADSKEIEIGLVGREGMTGLFVLMGNHQSPYQT
jgi:CRP-like cAMP-binding protein